jgi:hypothetical protein
MTDLFITPNYVTTEQDMKELYQQTCLECDYLISLKEGPSKMPINIDEYCLPNISIDRDADAKLNSELDNEFREYL